MTVFIIPRGGKKLRDQSQKDIYDIFQVKSV